MVVALGRNDRAPAPGTFNDAWVLTNASDQCTAGQPCNYAVEATDSDAGDVLTFSLDAAPAGMTIDATSGLIQWTPTPEQIGDHNVVVRVRDAGGLFVTQSFTLTVAPVAVPNVVGFDPASAEALIGAADLVVGTLTNVGGEITLDFNLLPSAQGWQYKNSTATDLNPNVSTPEASVFSISQGILHQDSFGLNTPAYYSQRDVIDARLPFSLSFRARVTEDLGDPTNNPYGFGFDLFAKQEIFQIGLSTGILAAFLNPRINFDNRTYHDYTLRGATGRGYRLSVDNVDVLTGKADSLQGSDRQSILLFGQLAGGRPNARADVQFLSFVRPRIIAQNPAPGTLVQNKSNVDLTVQDGPATATVPNVVGQHVYIFIKIQFDEQATHKSFTNGSRSSSGIRLRSM